MMNQIPTPQQPLPNSWATPQRQAKAGLLIIIFNIGSRLLKMLWLPLIAIFYNGNKKGIDRFEITLISIPVIILIGSLIEYFFFRFFIVNDELTIRKGFIKKKTITIPLKRIQGVHIDQNLLHQIANVAKVKIDTAGSEKTEAVIDAISMRKAEELKAFLLHEKQAYTDTDSAHAVYRQQEKPVMHLSIKDLLKLGISANHIQALFVVFAFALTTINNLGDVFGDRVYDTIQTSSDEVRTSMVAVALVIIAVLLISIVVSLVRIVLRYFDFQLSETTQGFKVKTGLINNQQTLVPFNKVQYISWEANWIRRKIGLYFMEFHQVTGNDRQSKKQRVKVPLTQGSYISGLLAHYHGLVQSDASTGQGIHTSYIFRRTLWFAILPSVVLAGTLLLITHNFWWLLLLLYIPFTAIHAWFFRRNFRFFTGVDALQVNSGIWGRKVEIVQWYKTQQVHFKQSIYQRQHDLATLHLNTAGGKIEIPYIPLKLAQEIRDYTLYKVESSDRSWM